MQHIALKQFGAVLGKRLVGGAIDNRTVVDGETASTGRIGGAGECGFDGYQSGAVLRIVGAAPFISNKFGVGAPVNDNSTRTGGVINVITRNVQVQVGGLV